jgi:hypothetical protein
MEKAYRADQSFPDLSDGSHDVVEDLNLLLDVVESMFFVFVNILLFAPYLCFIVIGMGVWLQIIFLGTSIENVLCAKVRLSISAH